MIRYAHISDAASIQSLVNRYAAKGKMLQISLNEIYEKIYEFVLWDEDDTIKGVCALHPTWSDMAEIRSLAVEPDFTRNGIGKALVSFSLERAVAMGFTKVFALTYMQPFFEACGFRKTDLDSLPKKVWTDCLKCPKYPACDETAVIIDL
ncbi:MAG: N-acetyltransferase [Mucispirillum sp.]|nr:N-acetyltransferase [Mucispirillum sp.]